MPILTTSVIWPAPRMASAKPQKASSVAATSGITSAASVRTGVPGGARSALCRTARFSVVLIFAPANMAARLAGTPARSASSSSKARAGAVSAVFE